MIDAEVHMPLAYKILFSFLRANPGLYRIKDDLEGEAMLALVEAAHKYKDMGLIEFSTYAAHEIHNKMVNYLERNENPYNRHVKLDDLLVMADSDEDDSELDWQDVTPGTVCDVSKALNRLTPESREFIETFVNQPEDTVRATREALGISWDEYNHRKSLVIEEISESC